MTGGSEEEDEDKVAVIRVSLRESGMKKAKKHSRLSKKKSLLSLLSQQTGSDRAFGGQTTAKRRVGAHGSSY